MKHALPILVVTSLFPVFLATEAAFADDCEEEEIAALEDYVADKEGDFRYLCSTADDFRRNEETCRDILEDIDDAQDRISELRRECRD
ncbi:MAG: hypothetical protein AB7T49_01050 [Oligoflexales bacterium]